MYLPPLEIEYKKLKFSSNFDSGNLFEIDQEANNTVKILSLYFLHLKKQKVQYLACNGFWL